MRSYRLESFGSLDADHPGHQVAARAMAMNSEDESPMSSHHRVCFGRYVIATLSLVGGSPTDCRSSLTARSARLVYRMLRYGMEFVDHGAEFYEARHRKREIDSLKNKARSLDSKSPRQMPLESGFRRGVHSSPRVRELIG